MKKEKIKNMFSKAKPITIRLFKYLIVGASIIASFIFGRFMENQEKEEVVEISTNVEKVNKDQVNIALDEGNNLIIIDNESGDYVIYQDSIGETIFKLYASNLWKQED